MSKEKLEAQTVFQDMQKKEALLKEFRNLRPNSKTNVMRFASTVFVVIVLVWMYPEIMEQPVVYVLLILIVSISSEIRSESKRINKRIDTLYKLMQSDD
ncbi:MULTISPECIES: hypothetical protein [unclassified Pseudoalteromonas]|uniref:hypothetical protein n=1 Tax=unclassified Pseudoalteromonas TaxID=194690 RepID=UPI00301434FC